MSSQEHSRTTTPPHDAVGLERKGREWLQRVSGAVRNVPWPFTLLELAWTAGPATLLAAWLGYYLGFGKTAPSENLIFFVAYTVVFGIIGIVTRVVTHATYGRRQREAQEVLLQATDRLPDLIAATRNLYLESLDPVTRRYEAAEMLLRRADLDAASVWLAVEQLTADSTLAQAAARIEMYRRNGMYSRVQEEVSAAAEATRTAVATIAERSPVAAAAIADRLHGRCPDQERGLPRDENFIERILSAAEQDNEELMTLLDAEELFIFTFELIAGRRITVLSFAYRGRWALARATDQLERRRNRYRIAKLTGYSRLKALLALLFSSDAVATSGSARGQQSTAMLDIALSGITELNHHTEQLAAEVARGAKEKRGELKRCVAVIASALRLITAMRRAFNHAGQRHVLFLRTIDKWNQLVAPGDRQPELTTTPGGLEIDEQVIALSDAQKLELAQRLTDHLKEEGVRTLHQQVTISRRNYEQRFSNSDAKTLAISIASALSDLIDLSKPEIQRAINNSNAANLGSIEPGLSAHTKAGWGNAVVQEVREELGSSAELLAATLVKRYGVHLSDDAIELLQREYGARSERLRALTPTTGSALLGAVTSLTTAPPNMDADPRWKQQLQRAERLVERFQ